jgi:outer membrane protein assembly factor BamB
MKRLLASGWLVVVFAGTAPAGDWTQFRGSSGTGSADADLPVRWSEKENVRWKVDLPGRGLSCPVIAGGRVYVTACTGFLESRLHVLCFDVVTGKRLWERQLWSTGTTVCHPKTCMAAPTPVTDGQRVYALFATGDLAGFDAHGNLLWYRSLARDYPTIGNNVGMAASPILWQDVLLLPMENVGESFVAGIDKFTGQNRWKNDRPRGINWVTPLLISNGGRPEVVFQSAQDVTGYDPATGRQLWSFSGGFSTSASPAAGNGWMVISTGEVLALRPGTDKQAPQVAWKAPKLKTTYSSPLYYRERVYAVNSAGVLNCADAANGNMMWQQRLSNKGPYWSSPVAAGDKLYLVNDSGITTVVQAGAEPKILAVNPLPETILATPAIADGAFFLRSDQHLYCIAHPKGK